MLFWPVKMVAEKSLPLETCVFLKPALEQTPPVFTTNIITSVFLIFRCNYSNRKQRVDSVRDLEKQISTLSLEYTVRMSSNDWSSCWQFGCTLEHSHQTWWVGFIWRNVLCGRSYELIYWLHIRVFDFSNSCSDIGGKVSSYSTSLEVRYNYNKQKNL